MPAVAPTYQPAGVPHVLKNGDIDGTDNPMHLSHDVFGDDFIRANSSMTFAANQAYFRLYRMQRSGFLRNISVMIDTPDAVNHLEIGVWDTGEAVAGKYHNLYVATAIAIGATTGVWITADPKLAVVQGQHLQFHVASDAATVKIASLAQLDQTTQSQLPFGSTSGGNQLKIAATKTSTYGATADIIEANMANTTKAAFFFYQITDNPS